MKASIVVVCLVCSEGIRSICLFLSPVSLLVQVVHSVVRIETSCWGKEELSKIHSPVWKLMIFSEMHPSEVCEALQVHLAAMSERAAPNCTDWGHVLHLL
jgi:hypothetical protein